MIKVQLREPLKQVITKLFRSYYFDIATHTNTDTQIEIFGTLL